MESIGTCGWIEFKIDLDTYQTETSNVFSTGTWLPNDGIVDGFGRGEMLHTNGFFQYGGVTGRGSLIEIEAFAEDGPADFEVLIDGEVAETFTAGNSLSTFQLQTDQVVTADQVRVQFSDDFYDPANGIDVNLVVRGNCD